MGEAMIVTLRREIFTPEYTLGAWLHDGKQIAFTCEDTVRGNGDAKTVSEWKVTGVSAIPYGRYRIGLEYSPRFKRVLPTIFSVPGFKGIRVHGGNHAGHSEGCPLVGLERTKVGVRNCPPALDLIMNGIEEEERAKREVFIEIVRA